MAVYETSNGNCYQFSFEEQADGSYRAYIIAMPAYGGRSTDGSVVHRLHDERTNRYYVCWNTALYSLAEIKAVAAGWAQRTDRYIRTGKPFAT